MNSSGISNPGIAPNIFDPSTLIGDLGQVKQNALQTLQASFKVLATVGTDGTSSAARSGLQELEAPSASRNVNDISLRIGLLQDALNQLMAKVSKTEIESRMNEMQKENQRQLEKFEDQMRKAAEAAEKNKEASKKGNIFEAVSNWIQAVVSVVSAIVTLVSAAAQVLTNPAGAAALVVAGVALIGAAAVQITLAIDSTLQAAGEKGFLSETDRGRMKKAVEILGYIALAGAMIGLVGGVVVGLSQAGRAAGTMVGQEVGKLGAAKLVATGMQEMAKQSVAMSIERYAAYAFQEAMKPLMRLATQMAVIQAVGQGTNAAVTGSGKLAVADIRQEASDLKAEADRAEAAAAAINAMVAKLRALIEQLQGELEKMVEEGQQTMQVIFGAIDESQQSMTNVLHTTSA
jgi:hypothetical protein